MKNFDKNSFVKIRDLTSNGVSVGKQILYMLYDINVEEIRKQETNSSIDSSSNDSSSEESDTSEDLE